MCLSGFQAPRSKLLDTIRVPGVSSRSRTKRQVCIGEKIEGHYRGGGEVLGEEIAFMKASLRLHFELASRPGVLL